MEARRDRMIHDWNLDGETLPRPVYRVEFDDETLRDGLQSPSVRTPSVEERVEILRLMDAMGIDTADIGLPGAGGIVREDTLRLAQAIVEERMKIAPNCAARTLEQDIVPIVEIVQTTGRTIEACLFIGSSPIRQYVENWTIDTLLEHTRRTVSFAVRQGLPVMFVTEDTTRAGPEDIRRLYLTAIECGARRICLCDTVGHATPNGVANLVRFVRRFLDDAGARDVKIDFHGHMDRGLGVWNSIVALSAGVHRVHGCAIGIGERVGNTPMDQLLVNLRLIGWIDNDLTRLYDYSTTVSRAVGVPIPAGYPVVGKDAFETATGVHAAAVVKALRRNDTWLADRVYSGVPAVWFGRKQVIRIGPMSGKSNVIWWLEEHGYQPTEDLVARILENAKRTPRLLTEGEIEAMVRSA